MSIMKILVAEDNVVNQKVAQAMFKFLGCDVTIANNGEEAVNACKDGDFDMIFMDCQMPVMDGYDASGAIRDWEQAAGAVRIPIVALTANATEGDREKCLAAGMDDYLSKPFSGDQIQEKVEKWIATS
ncbi:MAG: response regulator [Porticoccaceae bacterium]|nr:response regulator [Porticoccaceae bacterium]